MEPSRILKVSVPHLILPMEGSSPAERLGGGGFHRVVKDAWRLGERDGLAYSVFQSTYLSQH